MHMLIIAMTNTQESQCHCTTLRKASRRISRLYDMALASSGLKVTQVALLGQIRRSGPVPVGELAEALVMDSGALAHTLKPLERDGLVSLSVDPKDRRSRLVALTPQGMAKLDETDPLWAKAHRGFEAAIGATTAGPLREALRRLVSEDFSAAFEKALAD